MKEQWTEEEGKKESEAKKEEDEKEEEIRQLEGEQRRMMIRT